MITTKMASRIAATAAQMIQIRPLPASAAAAYLKALAVAEAAEAAGEVRVVHAPTTDCSAPVIRCAPTVLVSSRGIHAAATRRCAARLRGVVFPSAARTLTATTATPALMTAVIPSADACTMPATAMTGMHATVRRYARQATAFRVRRWTATMATLARTIHAPMANVRMT